MKEKEHEEIHKYILIPHLKHKIQIHKNLSKFEIELIKRKENHDDDKKHDVIEATDLTLKNIAIFEHKLKSRHHPDGNPEMNLIDYIEMLSDWISYWQANNIDKKLWVKKLEFYCKKYLIPKKIKNILAITLRDFFLGRNNE